MAMALQALADRIGAVVRGDGQRLVSGCAALVDAGPQDVSFLANRRYAPLVSTTRAGAVILGPVDAAEYGERAEGQARGEKGERTLLVADDPYFAFREAVSALHGTVPQPRAGIRPGADVHPDAIIGRDCSIQSFVVVSAGARIGDDCVLHPGCCIGQDVTIGAGSILYPNVTVYRGCVIGDRVTLHAGCVVGVDGFGYATHAGVHHKITPIGNVVIEDDVEMGAGCVIERATVGSTCVGRGSKFSDLIAIGHGAQVGPYNLLVAQVGMAGSARSGSHVSMGGQAGVAGHLTIGDRVQVAAKAGVMSDLAAETQVGGQPAVPLTQAKRNVLNTRRIPDLIRDLRRVQARVTALEAMLAARAESTG